MTTIDPALRPQLEALLHDQGMDNLDAVTHVLPDRVIEEVSLWAQYPEITFLAHLTVGEQDEVLVEFAMEHLERILVHAAAAGEQDYSAMLSFGDWDWVAEGDPVQPRFLLTHPSRGYFKELKSRPATTLPARYVARLVGDLGRYEVRETMTPSGEVARIFVRRRDQPEHLPQADPPT